MVGYGRYSAGSCILYGYVFSMCVCLLERLESWSRCVGESECDGFWNGSGAGADSVPWGPDAGPSARGPECTPARKKWLLQHAMLGEHKEYAELTSVRIGTWIDDS